MRFITKITTAIETQYPNQFLWSPVFLALGIACYFTLSFEPSPALLIAFAIVGIPAFIFLVTRPSAFCKMVSLLMLTLIGFAWAGGSTHRASAPKIEGNYYGPLWGRVVTIDKSYSDKKRITLDKVTIPGLAREKTPARVRISLHDKTAKDEGDLMLDILPGDYVMTTAHLNPPAGPVEPGGFDFSRHAWFLQIGGLGYTRVPVLKWKEADTGALFRLARLRMRIANAIQNKIPNQEGRFASAILTGNRTGLDPNTIESLRKTNLSHMLAISGLHMGLVAGFIFVLTRLALLAVSRIYKTLPTKKIAALIAMSAALVYLYISGASIATQRAYIMIVVAFVAVLIDRQAISLRSIALAALIVLTLQPQSLLNPGFQMSFAATTALVVVFSSPLFAKLRQKIPSRFIHGLLCLLTASLTAGLATAPIAAAYFNQTAQYGLLANLLAMPVMGSAVMPGGVIAAILAPIGLDEIGLSIMRIGITWILLVANEIASWPNAVRLIIAPPPAILGLLYGGLLILILWIGWMRWAGCALTLLAISLWTGAKRPTMLVSENLKLVGILSAEGRSLNRRIGEKFTANAWLENDADAATQEEAFTRPGITFLDKHAIITLGEHKIIHAQGRKGIDAAFKHCEDLSLIIATHKARNIPANCPEIITPEKARSMGAFAVGLTHGEITFTGSLNAHSPRLWRPNYPPRKKRQ